MYQNLKKQCGLLVLVTCGTVIFVEGSHNNTVGLPTRKQLHGNAFKQDMQITAHRAQEQKKRDADHPISQNPEHLARLAQPRYGYSAAMNSYPSEQSYSIARAESTQPRKEKKVSKPKKNKAVPLNEVYANYNATIAAADAFELEEEMIEEEQVDFKNKPQFQKLPKTERKERLGALGFQPVSKPVVEEHQVMQLEDQNSEQIEQNPSKHKRDRIFSEIRPAVRRNDPESTKRMNVRAEAVAQHKQFSGGTWDYRNEKTFGNGSKK